MKKLILTGVLFCLVTTAGIAQRVAITSASMLPSGQYQIRFDFMLYAKIPYPYPAHINDQLRTPSNRAIARSNKEKGTVTFIEFGDGTFSFDSTGEHTYNSSVLTYPVLTKSSAIYDDDKRPPRHTLTSERLTIVGTSPPPGSPLPVRGTMTNVIKESGDYIKITPNIPSVVAGDTMIFVLTYHLQESTSGNAIRFRYNNIPNIRTFYTIDLNSLIKDNDNQLTVPPVRTYGEFVKNAEGKDGFSDELIFSNLKLDDKEHHIFITLVPDSLINSSKIEYTDPVKVIAEVLKGDGTGTSKKGGEPDAPVQAFEMEMPSLLMSHDPNYVTITPGCNSFPKKGKLLNFHVHCQNEGLGQAAKVVMKITLPGGLKPLDVKNYGQFKSLAPYGRVGVWDFDNPNFITVTFDSHCNNPPPVNHPYILVGASSDPADIYNPETMADAWFTVPANENMNNLILSTADIIFTNKSNCSVNAPVTTNIGIAEFSNCCNCTKKKTCGCKKTKKKFWNWLFCKKC